MKDDSITQRTDNLLQDDFILIWVYPNNYWFCAILHISLIQNVISLYTIMYALIALYFKSTITGLSALNCRKTYVSSIFALRHGGIDCVPPATMISFIYSWYKTYKHTHKNCIINPKQRRYRIDVNRLWIFVWTVTKTRWLCFFKIKTYICVWTVFDFSQILQICPIQKSTFPAMLRVIISNREKKSQNILQRRLYQLPWINVPAVKLKNHVLLWAAYVPYIMKSIHFIKVQIYTNCR